VPFDRAAEFYDRTRAISQEAMARNMEVLSAELDGRGPVLEVGVGTGLLALPLHEAGLPLDGLDLSAPMLAKIVEKSGGRTPLPLVLADATRMPFPDGAFGGAYLRWVLHLIREWERALAEMVRVVRPGGVALVNLGAYGGAHAEIQARFAELAGVALEPAGLDWGDVDGLDRAMRRLGAVRRDLPPLADRLTQTLADFVRGIEENRYSWTWVVDDDVRRRAYGELVPWAEERFGPLERPGRYTHRTRWIAYDLDGSRSPATGP
jgi:SAM-dependent methyltransferase